MPRTATPFMPFEFDVETSGQMVETGGVEADPSWRHVDSNGHGHFHHGGQDPYPTLRWVSEPCTMDHGDDCTSEGHYECKMCGEEIRPGTQLARPVWIDGPHIYRLTIATDDGQRVTYEFGEHHWEQLQTAWVNAAQDTLDGLVIEVSRVG